MDRLVIMHHGQELSASLCRTGRKAPLPTVFHALLTGTDAAALRGALETLRMACLESGHKGARAAWSGTARVCLPADAALVRDWELPPTTSATARKSLYLLLEEEFACMGDVLVHRPLLTRDRDRGCIGAVTVSLPAAVMALWREALESCGLAACDLTVSPWPVLACLPPGEPALLIQAEDGQCTLAALNAENTVLRVGSPGFCGPDAGEPAACAETLRQGASDLARKAALVLNGLAFTPRRLLLHGSALDRPGVPSAMSAAFDLPVALPGRDIPLAGRAVPVGHDPRALVAHAVACAPARSIPLFGIRLRGQRWQRKLTANRPLAAGLLALLLGCCAAWSMDALSTYRQAAWVHRERLAQLRLALPDAPARAGEARLRSILKSRLAELEGQQAAPAGHAVLRLLEGIHALTPPDLQVEIRHFGLNNGQCRIAGNAASFAAVNALRDHLSALEGITSVRILSAAHREQVRDRGNLSGRATENGAVSFELGLIWSPS